MSLVHLDWFWCYDGYRLEERKPRPRPRRGPLERTGARILNLDGGGVYVVRNSKRLKRTQPLKCEGLYRQLAACWISDDVLAFVENHGLLTRGKEQRVDEILSDAENLRNWIRAISARNWPGLTNALEAAGQDSAFGHGGIGKLGVVFHYQEGMDRPELRFRPGSLLSAIYVQVLMDATGGATLRKCLNPVCPEWFKYGPGTEHRETAIYCSPKCQKAHAYMKLKEKRK